MIKKLIIILPVFLPLIEGLILLSRRHRPSRARNIFSFACSLVNLALVLAGAFLCEGISVTVFSFVGTLDLTLGYDGLGRLFAVLVSVLWPFSLLYSYEYMKNEERKRTFYSFYLMALGTTLGIAYSSSLFTMYIFYEMLTLVTFPLVMHTMTKQALRAGLKYLCYMLGGAAFAFVGMIVIYNYAGTLDFIPGGIFTAADPEAVKVLVPVFFVVFCGFSVKAALMPFGKWLISAAIAPMPVTGLLHAVAVVKAGAFACIRLIYYVYGSDILYGTWAQYACIILVCFTIVYGSVMAVREQHFKRRLAYSTISNLSYVLFGALIMTPAGLTASVTHLVVHAVTKLALFFAAGSVMHMTGRSYVYELDGIGKKMKTTFALFTLAGLSLVGIPPLGGFVSKLRLIIAAVDDRSFTSIMGAFAIIVSAFLTAVYICTLIVRAYFPVKRDDGTEPLTGVEEAGLRMTVPVAFAAICSLALGFVWEPLISYIEEFASLV